MSMTNAFRCGIIEAERMVRYGQTVSDQPTESIC